jgi:hypothetical protein
MSNPVYTAPVTSKKGVIGCESPKARGAEPHPARFAAFLFQVTSFGGPNGRAQALPVTLRVPRSLTPVRAAAQCESWSVVVHQAQLEINMTSIPQTHHAARVVDFINELADHHQAFEAVERLICVEQTDTSESLSHVDRSQLAWLFLVLNAAMRECISKSKAAALAAYEHQLTKGGHHVN